MVVCFDGMINWLSWVDGFPYYTENTTLTTVIWRLGHSGIQGPKQQGRHSKLRQTKSASGSHLYRRENEDLTRRSYQILFPVRRGVTEQIWKDPRFDRPGRRTAVIPFEKEVEFHNNNSIFCNYSFMPVRKPAFIASFTCPGLSESPIFIYIIYIRNP